MSSQTSDTAKVLAFIASRPSHSNVYAELIPYLNAMASVSNPGWMSIILIFLLIAHISILVLSALVLKYHLRRGDYMIVRRQKNGLIKPNRILVESIGALSYAALSIVDMSCQLYTDYAQIPVNGKVLTFSYRYPISWLGFWCIMWGCITNHIRAVWDPTFREDAGAGCDSMPRWVVRLLNCIFVFFAALVLLANPIVVIPAHLLHTQILNTLDGVNEALRFASKQPDALSYSLGKLALILNPLNTLPKLLDQASVAIRNAYYFSAGLDFSLMAIYSAFVFLTYRQFKLLKMASSTVQVNQNADQRLRFNYEAELKVLFIEAVTILFMLFSYIPMFVWGVTARTDAELASSQASVMVPELTLGVAASFVGNIVMAYRLTSARRLTKLNAHETKPEPTHDYKSSVISDQASTGSSVKLSEKSSLEISSAGGSSRVQFHDNPKEGRIITARVLYQVGKYEALFMPPQAIKLAKP